MSIGVNMKFQIIWNAFFKVKNEEKAIRLINQLRKELVNQLFQDNLKDRRWSLRF